MSMQALKGCAILMKSEPRNKNEFYDNLRWFMQTKEKEADKNEADDNEVTASSM